MIAADRPQGRSARLLTIDVEGTARHLRRSQLGTLFGPGDLIVANDAATLPASLRGTHLASREPIEVRLAGWVSAGDPTRFVALAFGDGDHRTPTENRPPPPLLGAGDGLDLGPLHATVEKMLDHPRLFRLRFAGGRDAILAGLARHGRPIQYAHVRRQLDLPDMWTTIAAEPMAFEPPSAGFALDWTTLAAWRRRGATIATITHAAGISSTGDPHLDRRLPFDEPYRIPEATAGAIARTKSRGGRVVAIGTTVVRALESAANTDGQVSAGDGMARNLITSATRLRIVDAILSGVHQRGESHFELLRAFVDDAVLDRFSAVLETHGYRSHEFGDTVLIEHRQRHDGALAGSPPAKGLVGHSVAEMPPLPELPTTQVA